MFYRLSSQMTPKLKQSLWTKCVNKQDREEDAKVHNLEGVTAAWFIVRRSGLVSLGTNSRLGEANAHDYQPAWQHRTTGIGRSAASCHISHVTSEISGTASTNLHL